MLNIPVPLSIVNTNTYFVVHTGYYKFKHESSDSAFESMEPDEDSTFRHNRHQQVQNNTALVSMLANTD